MEGSRNTIWYEDIERHRQPSLYYLSSEDDPAGPHLICDWNGAPTNFDEFDFDIMSKLIEMKPAPTKSNRNLIDTLTEEYEEDGDDRALKSIIPKTSCSHTVITENDGSSLDFLTVPPMVNSLLKRVLMSERKNRPKPIPEEKSNSQSNSTSDALKKRGRIKKIAE